MPEIARRFVLLACLLGAIATALVPRNALLRVTTVDMAERQKRKPFAGKLTLEEFIAQETEDRLILVAGKEWEVFFASALAAASGQPEDRAWAKRQGRGFCQDCLFFHPEEPPLRAVTGDLGAERPFTYLGLSRGGETEYLGVTYLVPRDALHSAPPAYLFPYRRYSLWLFLVGVSVYVFLPRRKQPPEAVYYSRVRAGVLPDFLGCLLAGMFFALPLWVIPANATDANVLSFADGWAWMTLICWGLGTSGMIILGWAAWYASYQLLVLPDRLLLTTWRGQEEFPYQAMTSVELSERRNPRWLIILGAITTLLNWRALGPTLILAGQSQRGIHIRCRDGRTLRIWAEGLVGLERLQQALQEAGVLMTEEAGALMEGKEVKKRPMSKARRKRR